MKLALIWPYSRVWCVGWMLISKGHIMAMLKKKTWKKKCGWKSNILVKLITCNWKEKRNLLQHCLSYSNLFFFKIALHFLILFLALLLLITPYNQYCHDFFLGDGYLALLLSFLLLRTISLCKIWYVTVVFIFWVKWNIREISRHTHVEDNRLFQCQ